MVEVGISHCMYTLYFRFYEELNDFLPPARHKVQFDYTIERKASIKDVIEALGVPHTEVGLILVNGESVDFPYCVQHNDRISVYPVFESLSFDCLYRNDFHDEEIADIVVDSSSKSKKFCDDSI